jgi:nucleoside phosphorylase
VPGLNDRSRNGDILIYRELTGAAGLEAATEAQPLLQPDEHLLDQALQCAQAKDCRCFTGRGLTVPEVINTPAGKQALGNRYQADTVDMESYWLAAMARSHKVPFIALRSIFDAVTDNLATLSSFFNQGKISYSALCAGLLAHPSQIGELLSFHRNADLAQRNLSGYLRQLFEYLQE